MSSMAMRRESTGTIACTSSFTLILPTSLNMDLYMLRGLIPRDCVSEDHQEDVPSPRLMRTYRHNTPRRQSSAPRIVPLAPGPPMSLLTRGTRPVRRVQHVKPRNRVDLLVVVQRGWLLSGMSPNGYRAC